VSPKEGINGLSSREKPPVYWMQTTHKVSSLSVYATAADVKKVDLRAGLIPQELDEMDRNGQTWSI